MRGTQITWLCVFFWGRYIDAEGGGKRPPPPRKKQTAASSLDVSHAVATQLTKTLAQLTKAVRASSGAAVADELGGGGGVPRDNRGGLRGRRVAGRGA
jgi:hypothetical protein